MAADLYICESDLSYVAEEKLLHVGISGAIIYRHKPASYRLAYLMLGMFSFFPCGLPLHV